MSSPPVPSVAIPAKKWTTVWQGWSVIPAQAINIRTTNDSKFAYRCYGTGFPWYFKITGNPGFAEQWLGWCALYGEVQVRTNTGANFVISPFLFSD